VKVVIIQDVKLSDLHKIRKYCNEIISTKLVKIGTFT